MTEKQEKAIDDLRFFYQGEYITREMEESAQIILKMLEEKDKEIEKYKQLYNKALYNTISADRENIELKKQIQLMANAFRQDDVRSTEEIIEYFENLAKGE